MRTQEERFELLKQWKEEKKDLTYADISRTSGVPLSTAQKIIECTTKDPSFTSVAPIIIALGHTLDEYYGIAKDDSKEVTIYSLMQSSYEAQLREKDIILELRLAEKESIIAEKDKAYSKLESDRNNREKFFHRIIFIMGLAMAIFFLICAIIAFVFLYHA